MHERRESASQTMWKLFLDAALIILACGLWSPVCPTVAPTSSADHSPLWWQSPAVSSDQPLPSPAPRALHLTTVLLSLPGKFRQLRCGHRTIPVPHPTLWSYFHHTYIQMNRQTCFCQLWLPDWKPEAAMRADAHALWFPQLLYKDQWRNPGTFIVFLCFNVPPDWVNFHNCMSHNFLLNSMHWKIKTLFCT